MTREEVVQAALKVERWCAEHMDEFNHCVKCPFCKITGEATGKCALFYIPSEWELETFLRTRGLKDAN